MKTKKVLYGIMGRIMELGGMNPDIEAEITALRDDVEERDNLLKAVYEPWDDEAEDVVLTAIETPAQRTDREYNELEGKYNDLVARYKSSFFSGGITHSEDIIVDEPEDVIDETRDNDEKPLRVADIFKEVN